MIEIGLRIVDSSDEVADKVARRLVADMAATEGFAAPSLVRRGAAPGERGIVQEIGELAVRLTSGGGVTAMVGLLRSVLRTGEREVVVKLPNGSEFTLKGGGLSDAQFGRTTDALLALLAQSGETA
jgi:hypothetical protein